MRRLLADFREFALRGNVLELAVAVILGLAFNAVVQSLVNDVLMNLVAAVFGEPDFDKLTFSVGDGVIRYGAFLNALLNFVLVALALFLVVKSFNRAKQLRGHEVQAPTTMDCPYCLTKIPVRARRCPACTTDVQPGAA